MSELMLIKSTTFNGVHFDCYAKPEQQDKSDFWATREQIGRLLDYVNPTDAIKKIHKRNKERLDKFSRGDKLSLPSGGTQEVIIYSFKGLLEICRYSHKPKANAVIDWLWEVADEIRRTSSYSLQQKQQQLPQQVHSLINAAEQIIHKAFACKTETDYLEVLALNNVFKAEFGYSALETAGISIVEEITYESKPIPFSQCGAKYQERHSNFELHHNLEWQENYHFNS